MATYTSIIYVTHSGYWVSEPTCNVSDNPGTEGDGLVGPGQGSATIQTGLEDGPVKVIVDNLNPWPAGQTGPQPPEPQPPPASRPHTDTHQHAEEAPCAGTT
ncbi:hypothetical protein [Streptomyces natalensis]|uniref:Uncharacterized protein n=1 Tax=Streptomyces natalensis ATCC 27448 TaxID=1240678 RepID=A0A0D7CK24_9ACTN|nr:hypothetical protein [Streptomyces natalensis]KIZ15767.1 hypothetical protein SNA_20785 [Streptomyces natalensis ATCC 27448]